MSLSRSEFSLTRYLVAPVLVMLCSVLAPDVLGDVRETPHNLIKSRDKSVSEKKVCVFCHTPLVEMDELPEGTGGAMLPRWQKSVAAGFFFTVYDDIGRLGLGKASVGSQSMACLSCHDSNQALTTGSGPTSDHPFGVPYRGAIRLFAPGASISTPRPDTTTPFRAAQHIVATEEFREASRGIVEDRAVFWVSRDGVTVRRTRNDLPLYARSDGGGTGLGSGMMVPHIECSSCHDPHAKTETFLRVSPTESRLCLTCHEK